MYCAPINLCECRWQDSNLRHLLRRQAWYPVPPQRLGEGRGGRTHMRPLPFLRFRRPRGYAPITEPARFLRMVLHEIPKHKIKKDKALGYEYFCDRTHPLANTQGKVYYHRHVASIKVGRWIRSGEHVHHKDGNRSNNAPSNIEVLTQAEHVHKHLPPAKQINCKRCGQQTTNKSYCSRNCMWIHFARRRPTRRQVAELVKRHSWAEIGRMYNVSHTSARRWAVQYKLI